MSELDGLMWEAWLKVRERVLGDEGELRRRLARRERTLERTPRALCIAVRASDRRITEGNAWISDSGALVKGEEREHEVEITSGLMRELCRPVEAVWLTEFVDVSRELGRSAYQCRELEKRGIVKGHRIALLGGKRGSPVPLVTSGVSAMEGRKSPAWKEHLVLDGCMRGHEPPHELLAPFWREMSWRLPEGMEQVLTRRPRLGERQGQRWQKGWMWVCPGCDREVRTIYFPMGAQDWAAARGIKLPEGWYTLPLQPSCLACYRCHRLFSLYRANRQGVARSWNALIGHMSGGLLYGEEVRRPASFGVQRKHATFTYRRASPRREELEEYLALTDLTREEIARRMGVLPDSVKTRAKTICKMRGVKGREGLKVWWTEKRLKEQAMRAA